MLIPKSNTLGSVIQSLLEHHRHHSEEPDLNLGFQVLAKKKKKVLNQTPMTNTQPE